MTPTPNMHNATAQMVYGPKRAPKKRRSRVRFTDPHRWTTTAEEDGDCAIYEEDSRKLVGVGATVRQSVNIVLMHNAALRDDEERSKAAYREHVESVATEPPPRHTWD